MRVESLLRRLVEELAYWRPSNKIVGCPALFQLVKKFGFVVGLPWHLAKYDEPVPRTGVRRWDEQERIPYRAIKTNIGDSVNVVVQLERRPGRRFLSEVVEINRYDPDLDEYDFGVIYQSRREQP